MKRELRVWSVIPPMTQLNTPYPATAYLTGFLRSQGWVASQSDLALELVLSLMSPTWLERLWASACEIPEEERSASVNQFIDHFPTYRGCATPVVRFLQGKDPTLAHRIAERSFLPEGPRFHAIEEHGLTDDADPLAWAFGALGTQDRAKHLATLFLNELADVWRDVADEQFEFVRYGEKLAASQPSFQPLADSLAAPPTLIDEALEGITLASLEAARPNVVLLSVPFPGAVYGALRIAQTIKNRDPSITVVLGGGFVNTELRELKTTQIFKFIDYITLDAGERPLLSLLEHLSGCRGRQRLTRTFALSQDGQRVEWINWSEPEIPLEDSGTPTWDGLPLDSYLSLVDMLNPMHRLWSDGRWNKLTVALGCYWKKCSFCDVTLDYISRYETTSAKILVDKIERIIAETGQTGFHFVDEAAPPKALKAMANEILRRGIQISWWGNIRFEKTFTPQLAQLLARSGCIALTGGLEVASDRLLQLMQKGVDVAQVAQVTRALSDAGIMVHAYLMYGFPTQTVQDTIDALEYVRQLFENGCIQSGFFHRFVCTVHAPVGQNPAHFGVELIPLPPTDFARNDLGFIDPTGVDHDSLGIGLRKAIYNFMHGIGLEEDVRFWFNHMPKRVPHTTVSRDALARVLGSPMH